MTTYNGSETSKTTKIDLDHKSPIKITHVSPSPQLVPDKPFWFVLDTEATADEDKSNKKLHMDPCAELISLSCQMSQVGTLFSTFHSLIQPTFNQVSPFCEGLTGISQEMVEIGGGFGFDS